MKAGITVYPHKYGKNRNTPTEADVVNALNVISGCAIGQAGMKDFEFPLTDLVFAGGLKGSQGSDRAVNTSQTPNPPPPGKLFLECIYCLTMIHRGASDDGSFLPCINDP